MHNKQPKPKKKNMINHPLLRNRKSQLLMTKRQLLPLKKS